MFSISPQVLNILVCSYPKWLKADFHHISRSGGFIILVDHLNGLGSGLGFNVSVGSSVGVVLNGLSTTRGWGGGGKGLVMAERYRLPCQTWLELWGKSYLPCCVRIQNWLEWGSGQMATVIWQCHHDQGVDLEGGR